MKHEIKTRYAAHLRVNPSLTISALTEHAMSHLPAKAAGRADLELTA